MNQPPSLIQAAHLAVSHAFCFFLLFLLGACSAWAAPPTNDNFESAGVLAGFPVNTTGSNIEATLQGGEPDESGGDGNSSVWWRWTAPSSGWIEIHTFGSDVDTLLSVYTGSALDTLSLIAFNDDSTSAQSRVRFEAAAGELYSIQVSGFLNNTGAINLALLPSTTPQPLILNKITLSADVVNLREDSPVSITARIDFSGPNGLELALMTFSSDNGDLWQVQSEDEEMKLISGSPLAGVYETTFVFPPYRPPGYWSFRVFLMDDEGQQTTKGFMCHSLGCSGEPLPVGSSEGLRLLNDGPVDRGEPTMLSATVAPDPVELGAGPQNLTMTVQASDDMGVASVVADIYDPVGDYVGEIVASRVAGTPVSGTYRGEMTLPFTAPVGEYSIEYRVEDVSARILDTSLPWTVVPAGVQTSFRASQAKAPANDNFANGIVLPRSASVEVTGTTTAATIQAGEDEIPIVLGGEPYPRIFSTVWYQWTPEVSGWSRCHTGGSVSDTVLRVSTGVDLPSQVRVGWNDEADFETGATTGEQGSGLVFWAEKDVTYHITVGAFNPTEPGPFTLHLENGPLATPAAVPTALAINPEAVDVTDGEREISVLLSISSGEVATQGSAKIRFFPHLTGDSSVLFSDESLKWDTTGAMEVTMNSTMVIPRYAEPGNWQGVVLLEGSFGNLSFGSADSGMSYILPQAASKALEVSNRAVVDQEPPVLSETSVSPSDVNVTARSETLHVSVRLTDQLSGVSGAFLDLRMPSSNWLGLPMTLQSGTMLDGRWSVSFTIPHNWPSGDYDLSIEFFDRLGQTDFVNLRRSKVTGGGGYYAWAVESAAADKGFSFDERLADPSGDASSSGVRNLLCYAFDLDPFDVAVGPGFLPEITLVGNGGERRLSIRFLRRKGSEPELRYFPEFNSGDGVQWMPATGTPVVTDLGNTWEVVTIEDTVSVSSSAQRMARVRVIYAD